MPIHITTFRYPNNRQNDVGANAIPLDIARMRLGQRIEALRIREGISQSELARRVGVRQSTINSLINGESRTSRSLVAIARELKTTPAYLTGETDDPSAESSAMPLTHQDREALDLMHQLSAPDRKALMQIMRRMVTPTPMGLQDAPG